MEFAKVNRHFLLRFPVASLRKIAFELSKYFNLEHVMWEKMCVCIRRDQSEYTKAYRLRLGLCKSANNMPNQSINHSIRWTRPVYFKMSQPTKAAHHPYFVRTYPYVICPSLLFWSKKIWIEFRGLLKMDRNEFIEVKNHLISRIVCYLLPFLILFPRICSK